MVLPILVGAAKVAQIAILKAHYISKMASIKGYLAAHIGATAANIGVGILASAAAAAMYAKMNGKSESEIAEAAMQAGVNESVAKAIANFIC